MQPIYDQNIVLDLEFTPVPRSVATRKFREEIIQIGAARVDALGNVRDTFCAYVKPQYAEHVIYPVQRLTGISFSDLEGAEELGPVLEAFRRWVGEGKTRYVSWSKTDRYQLRGECRYKQLAFPEDDERWLDLQVVYPRMVSIENGRSMGLRTAADWYGITVDEEQLHGALYDARLTAELMHFLMSNDYLKQKAILSDTLKDSSDDQPLTNSIGSKFAGLADLMKGLESN